MKGRREIGNLLMALAGLLLMMVLIAVGWNLWESVGQFSAFLKGTVSSEAIKAQTSTLTEDLSRIFYVALIGVPCALVLGVIGLILRLAARKPSNKPTTENPP